MTFLFENRNCNICRLYYISKFNLVNFNLDFNGTSRRVKDLKFVPVELGMKLHHLYHVKSMQGNSTLKI